MTPEHWFQVGCVVLGVVLGVVLDRVAARIVDARTKRQTKALIVRELSENISRLEELRATIDAYPGDLGLTEIGERIVQACRREMLDACLRDLPTLGAEVMGKVFDFYDGARSTAHAFGEIETWQGNIRSTLVDDHMDQMRNLAKDALSALV